METVSREQVGSGELALPPRVQEALGELVGSAKEGLLALSVGVGLGALAELMEEEVDEVVGHMTSLAGRSAPPAQSVNRDTATGAPAAFPGASGPATLKAKQRL